MRALKIAKSLVSGKPSYLIMYVTNKCNSRCRTCFIYDSLNNPNNKEMTLDEITKLTKSFKSCCRGCSFPVSILTTKPL